MTARILSPKKNSHRKTLSAIAEELPDSPGQYFKWYYMKIWVDADACPVVIKEILFRAAERTGTQITLVANRQIPIPSSGLISFIRVSPGFDVADNEIVKRLSPGDLVITADIPLAAEVIEHKGHALNPRGELYTVDTIKSRLSMRNFLDSLRATGIDTGGPPALNNRDRQKFANQLDRFLTSTNDL